MRIERCERRRTRAAVRGLLGAAVVLCGVLVQTPARAQSGPYTLNWSSVTAGGIAHLRSSCYQLSGSIGFAGAPGMLASSPAYTLYTGFWVAAPIFGQDEIFFDGFEDCTL